MAIITQTPSTQQHQDSNISGEMEQKGLQKSPIQVVLMPQLRSRSEKVAKAESTGLPESRKVGFMPDPASKPKKTVVEAERTGLPESKKGAGRSNGVGGESPLAADLVDPCMKVESQIPEATEKIASGNSFADLTTLSSSKNKASDEANNPGEIIECQRCRDNFSAQKTLNTDNDFLFDRQYCNGCRKVIGKAEPSPSSSGQQKHQETKEKEKEKEKEKGKGKGKEEEKKREKEEEKGKDKGKEKDEKSTAASIKTKIHRLFGGEKPVHKVLGGGKPADVFLWRDKKISSGVLGFATAIWVLFELFEYHLLTLVCHVLILGLALLFLWSNASTFINKSPPQFPEVILPEDIVLGVASALRIELNRAFSIIWEIASGRDLKKFLAVIAGLWVFSILGGCCNFLTLFYISFVLLHTVPFLYEKYEEQVDAFAEKAEAEIIKCQLCGEKKEEDNNPGEIIKCQLCGEKYTVQKAYTTAQFLLGGKYCNRCQEGIDNA